MTGVMVSCGVHMFDVSVRGCGYKAAGSAVNGLWWPELRLQKARGHSTALSVLLPPCLSDSVHHSLAWPHLWPQIPEMVLFSSLLQEALITKLNTAFLSFMSYPFYSGQSKQNILQLLCYFPFFIIFNLFTISCCLGLDRESVFPGC